MSATCGLGWADRPEAYLDGLAIVEDRRARSARSCKDGVQGRRGLGRSPGMVCRGLNDVRGALGCSLKVLIASGDRR